MHFKSLAAITFHCSFKYNKRNKPTLSLASAAHEVDDFTLFRTVIVFYCLISGFKEERGLIPHCGDDFIGCHDEVRADNNFRSKSHRKRQKRSVSSFFELAIRISNYILHQFKWLIFMYQMTNSSGSDHQNPWC